MQVRLAILIATASLGWFRAADALDPKDLPALRASVHDMCVQPDRKGDYLKVDGDLNAEATLRVVGVEASGKITKEEWNGVSQKLDQYKTDPRECAVSLVGLLAPLLSGKTVVPPAAPSFPNFPEIYGKYPDIGVPKTDIIIATHSALAINEHATVLWLLPLSHFIRLSGSDFVLDYNVKTLEVRPEYFDDDYLRKILNVPQGCKPPKGGIADLWQEHSDWRAIGCRLWGCWHYTPGAVRYQVFANGYVIAGFPVWTNDTQSRTFIVRLLPPSWDIIPSLRPAEACAKED